LPASRSFLSRAPEAKPDAAHGLDEGLIEAPIELVAEVLDEGVDDVRRLVVRPVAPHMTQYPVALNDFVAVVEEELEQ
jgi:hypothetical protein